MVSGIKFTGEAARLLEAVYMTPDVVAQRSETLKMVDLAEGAHVVDMGCSPGFLCQSMAERVGNSGRVVGIDISEDMIAFARQRNDSDWVTYEVGDVTAMELPDAGFDVAVCTQVAEYLAEVGNAIAEAFRVLKPGGRALFLATDWDTVVWHSDNPARMAAVMKLFEAHCADPRLPRSMPANLRAAGFAVESASVFPILNLAWNDDSYSKGASKFVHDFLAARADMAADELAAWADEMPRLSEEGRYFFCNNRFIFLASKPS